MRQEAQLVDERLTRFATLQGVLTQSAAASLFGEKAAKEFTKLVKRLNGEMDKPKQLGVSEGQK